VSLFFVLLHTYIYIYVHICMKYIHIYMYTYVYIYNYMYVSKVCEFASSLCFVCSYIYVYHTYTRMHTCIHMRIYICKHTCVNKNLCTR